MRGRRFDRTTTPTTKAVIPSGRRPEAPAAGTLDPAPPAAVANPAGRATPDPAGQARALVRASGGRLARAGGTLLQLQRDYGNQHVRQVLDHARRSPHATRGAGTGLTLGPAGDRHERAADAVARQVAGSAPGRRTAGHAEAGQGPMPPSRHANRGAEGDLADAGTRQAIRTARGGGRPLPERLRDAMEPAVGTALDRVRLHTDARADRLTRGLRARAFTTGSEIFFRRGEYRPDSPAGRSLLAHELTHVGQQAEAPAGAGVIQRVRIEGLDTQVPSELRELLKKVETIWDPDAIAAMRAEVDRQLGLGQPRTREVERLIGELDTQAALARSKASRERRQALKVQAEPVVKAPSGRPTSLAAPPTEASGRPERGAWTPEAKREVAEHREVPPERKREPPERPESGSAITSPEPRPTSGRRVSPERPSVEEHVPPAPEPSRSVPRPLTVVPPVTSLPRPAVGAAALLGEVGQTFDQLTAWVTALELDPGGADAGAAVERLAREAAALEARVGDLKRLSFRDRTIRDDVVAAESRLGQLQLRVKRVNRDVGARGQQRQDAQARQAMLARRQGEVEAGKGLLDRYVGTVEFQNPDGGVEHRISGQADLPPRLPLEWVLIKAIEDLDGRSDRWVGDLMDYLRTHRASQRSAGEDGPWVELVGTDDYGIRGRGYDNLIHLDVGLRGQWTERFLTAEGPATGEPFVEMVRKVARGFAHEAAHLSQLRVYRNVSFPFGSPRASVHPKDVGIALALVPDELRLAYEEFAAGGKDGAASSDPEWQRAFKGIASAEYHGADFDYRGRELVSHLIEVAYIWRSPERFERAFPRCGDLLDRVIRRGD